MPVGGVPPVKRELQGFYYKLSVQVPFTGRLRLAKGFIADLYVHMGYQKATAFKTVYDITLENGRVVEVKDRSDEMEKKRGAFKIHFQTGNMFKTIDEAFSLEMILE